MGCSTIFWHCYIFGDVKLLLIALNYCIQEKKVSLKVSVKENEVPTEKKSSRASIFATKASYIPN